MGGIQFKDYSPGNAIYYFLNIPRIMHEKPEFKKKG